MKKVLFLMILPFLLLGTASVKGQVSIGSGAVPHEGAVLDLSQVNGKKLGFLLPQVSLTTVSAWQLAGTSAVGMVVYNTNPNTTGGSREGVYVWTGEGNGWKPLNALVCYSVTDREGHTYSAANFGEAGCWMTQNLRSTYNDVIPSGTLSAKASSGTSGTSQKNYYYPGNSEDLFKSHPEYGLLYTWAAASGRTDETLNEGNNSHAQYQGICPQGWHLPSDSEWSQLEKEIANSVVGTYGTAETQEWTNGWESSTGYRPDSGEDGHGKVMKSTTKVKTTVGKDAATDDPGGASCAERAVGFNALLVGEQYNGSASLAGVGTYMWTSSCYSEEGAWSRGLRSIYSGMYRGSGVKVYLRSVRCKKN
jgi:uncharacterized protein (TIGR02145 family)